MLILRPASWLALLTRTFTFELSLAGSPRANVEYDYVGKQSIPTTGLSPASPTALWAAIPDLTPRSRQTPRSRLALDLGQEPFDRDRHQLGAAEGRHVAVQVGGVKSLASHIEFELRGQPAGDVAKDLGGQVVGAKSLW